MTHLGGGDIAAHDERRLSRFSCRRNTRPVESLLYTANNQHNGEAAVENAVLHRKLTVLPGQRKIEGLPVHQPNKRATDVEKLLQIM